MTLKVHNLKCHQKQKNNWYLNKSSSFCEFEKLDIREMIIEDELIQLRLVMCDALYKCKILQWLQLTKMSLDASVKFLQQLIEKFNTSKHTAYQITLCDANTVIKSMNRTRRNVQL